MFEGEPLNWIGQVGGWGGMVALTALLWWSLATGRLLTKGQHESVKELQDKAITKLEAANAAQQKQIEALIESNRTAKDFFEKVPVEERPSQGDQT